jgi:hypothetical protein
LGRDGRRGKVLCLVVTYWLGILHMDKEEFVRCYVWQISNLKFGSWAKKLCEELDNIGMGKILQHPQGNSVSRTCKIEGKAVPLHAMEEHEGRGGIAPTHT